VERFDPEAVGYWSYDYERHEWVRDDEQEARWASWLTGVFAELRESPLDADELRWALRVLWGRQA
jgi:hypothetical protein